MGAAEMPRHRSTARPHRLRGWVGDRFRISAAFISCPITGEMTTPPSAQRVGRLRRVAIPWSLALLTTACTPRGQVLAADSISPPPGAASPADIGVPPPPDASYVACATPRVLGAKHLPLRLGELWLRPEGQRLVPAAGTARAASWIRPRLRLGVVANARHPAAQTLTNLRFAYQRFRQASVDAIAILGGWGGSASEIRALLRPLLGNPAEAGPPLLLLPGDQLPINALPEALQGWQQRVIVLHEIRAIDYPPFTLLSLPGTNYPHHLATAQGCAYGPQALRALGSFIPPQLESGLLLAYVPPRGGGDAAIDRTRGLAHIGDPELGATMRQFGIAFGAFGAVPESGLRATTHEGRAVAPGEWSTSLIVNAGSIEALPQERVDGGWSWGGAVVIELDKKRARYRPIAAPPPPEYAATPGVLGPQGKK